jgi:hypothetical protein
VLVDSGRTYTDGQGQPFEPVYRALVDEALTEPPLARIHATVERDSETNRLWVRGTITNVSDITIGYDNTAMLWIMAYVEEQVHYVDWFVRRAVFSAIDDDIAPGATQTFEKAVVLPLDYIDEAKIVVMVDYKPADENGKYWSANSALAVPPSVLQSIFMPVGFRRAPALGGS